MKVLYLIDSLAGGGAERSLVEMVPALVAAGVDLTVATLHDRPGFSGSARDGGATVVTVRGGGYRHWVTAATELTRQLQPDVVHTTLFASDVVGRLASFRWQPPVTGSLVHGYDLVDRQPTVPRWKQRTVVAVEALTARRSPLLHAVSQSVADSAARHLRYPQRRIRVVERGRNAEALGRRTVARRAAARVSLGLRDEHRLVLLIGRHEHEKGFESLIASLLELRAQVPDVVLRIAGRKGRASSELLEAARRVGLDEAIFLGERDDIPELLCAADVFVLSSYSEGMPGALLEAMALEVPVVARRIPAAEAVMGNACSYVVTDGEWPAAIARALDDDAFVPARRALFRERFTADVAAKGMVGFWREVAR